MGIPTEWKFPYIHGANYQEKMLAAQDMTDYTKQMKHKDENPSHGMKVGWHEAECWESLYR